jgi:hypothetical protein
LGVQSSVTRLFAQQRGGHTPLTLKGQALWRLSARPDLPTRRIVSSGWTKTLGDGNLFGMSVNPDFVEECDTIRPDWSLEDGVASSFPEFLIALNEPLGFGWLAILALFLWTRSVLLSVLLSLLSVCLLAYLNWEKYAYDELFFGQLGGCVGSLVVTNIVLWAAFLLGVAALSWRWHKRA